MIFVNGCSQITCFQQGFTFVPSGRSLRKQKCIEKIDEIIGVLQNSPLGDGTYQLLY